MPWEIRERDETHKLRRWVYTPSGIRICDTCLQRFIPVPKDSTTCLLCKPTTVKTKPERTLWETDSWYSINNKYLRKYRKNHRDKVNEWKRGHKDRHPESVKKWNKRYRIRNGERLATNDKFIYLREKMEKTTKPVNGYIIAEPISNTSYKTRAGIIVELQNKNSEVKWANTISVCDNPMLPIKKGTMVAYKLFTPFINDDKEHVLINIGDIMAIK